MNKHLSFDHQVNIENGESVKLSPRDIERMLALIDLMFIDEDESRVIPS